MREITAGDRVFFVRDQVVKEAYAKSVAPYTRIARLRVCGEQSDTYVAAEHVAFPPLPTDVLPREEEPPNDWKAHERVVFAAGGLARRVRILDVDKGAGKADVRTLDTHATFHGVRFGNLYRDPEDADVKQPGESYGPVPTVRLEDVPRAEFTLESTEYRGFFDTLPPGSTVLITLPCWEDDA